MAADLEVLLSALEVERAPVVGWSLGGFVAQQLAARAPERVAALALLATDPGGPDSIPADPETWSRLVDHSGTSREQASRLISLANAHALAGHWPGARVELFAGCGHALMTQEPRHITDLIRYRNRRDGGGAERRSCNGRRRYAR